MKKIQLTLMLLLCSSISWATIPDSQTNPDPSHIQISADGSVTLLPHGFAQNFPAQDSVNLQWVFRHYPHANINLSAGTYHISEAIEAAGYQGTINGQGQNATYLVGRGPLNAEGQYEFPLLSQDLQTRFYPSGVPSLIWFHALDGDVNQWDANAVKLKLSNLTIHQAGVGPQISLYQVPFRTIWGMVAVTGRSAVMSSTDGPIDHAEINVDNVTFQGDMVQYTLNGQTYNHPNTAAGIVSYGGEDWYQDPNGLNGWDESDHQPINGKLQVSNSKFFNLHQFAVGPEAYFTKNTTSNYQFPTNPVFPSCSLNISQNTFDNIGGGINDSLPSGYSLLIFSTSECDTSITQNKFDNNKGIAIALLRGMRISIPEGNTVINVSSNKINMIPSPVNQSAIAIYDLTLANGTPMIANITTNKFYGDQGYNKSFIEHAMGTNMTASDNKFSGYAASAVSSGASVLPFPPYPALPTYYDSILNNDVSALIAGDNKIILGSYSYYATVITDNVSDVTNTGVGNTIETQ